MQRKSGAAGAHAWLLPLMTAGLACGMLLGRCAPTWLYGAGVLVLSSVAALLLPGRLRLLSLTLAAAGLGAWLAFGAWHPVRPAEGDYAVTGVIVQEISLSSNGRAQTVLAHVTLDGEPVGSGAYWTWYVDDPEQPFPEGIVPGAAVEFTARVYHPSGAQNPGGFDFNEYLLQRGMTYGLYDAKELAVRDGGFTLSGWFAAVRHDLTMHLMAAMGEESGAYAAAVLLGSRDYLPNEDVEAFRRLGIAHVLSVSGWHVGLLVVMLGLLMQPLHLPRGAGVLVRAAILTGYCMLTGGNAPVIRATLLLLLRELGSLRHRKNLPLHTVCLAAALQLIASPAQLTSASFQLTYSAILGMLLVHPWLKRRFAPATAMRGRIWSALSATLSAQLGVLPAQLYWFAEFPVLSVGMNLFILGLMSAVMTMLWVTLALLPIPWLGSAAAVITGSLTAWMLAGIRALASALGMMLWTKEANGLTLLGWALVMAGLCILLPRRGQRLRRWLTGAGAVMIALSLIPLPHRGTEWMQFSVGEEDAALLWDDGMVVVVDAGAEANDLHDYLRGRRLSVDLLILTHLHTDHAGGASAFVDMGIPVKRCVLPVDAEAPGDVDEGLREQVARLAESGTEIIAMSRGDVIDLPHGRLTALWPQEGFVRAGMGANDACLTLLAELRGTTMLLAADLTGTYEMYCAEPADLLKAAHHGSAESTLPDFLRAVDPQVILLSCGNESRETGMLARTGSIPLYSTDSQGAITVRFTEGAFTVETFLPENFLVSE